MTEFSVLQYFYWKMTDIQWNEFKLVPGGKALYLILVPESIHILHKFANLARVPFFLRERMHWIMYLSETSMKYISNLYNVTYDI